MTSHADAVLTELGSRLERPLDDGQKAEIIQLVDDAVRAAEGAVARERRARIIQIRFLLGLLMAMGLVLGFWWLRYGKVEAKAKAIVWRVLNERGAAVARTAHQADRVMLQQIVEWMKEVRDTPGQDPVAQDIRFRNLATIGDMVQRHKRALEITIKNSEDAARETPERIDMATWVRDPFSGRKFVLNATDARIDQDLLGQLLRDENMQGGIMAQALAYSLKNSGQLPPSGRLEMDPEFQAATGLYFRGPGSQPVEPAPAP